jgi:phosphohistidine phosphatase
LLRHAKSSWGDPGLDDRDRPLNKRGQEAAAKLADHLRHSAVRPALVLCSPAVRTRQTLDLIAPGLGLGVTFRIENSLYGATAQGLWRLIRELPDDLTEVMLIGHNPGVHELAQNLAGDGDDAAMTRLRHKLPTGSLVTLAWGTDWWSSLRQGDGVLHSFIRPRDL